MRKRKSIKWYRSPRSAAEKRINADPEITKYVRAKRRAHNLPDSWDDYPITVTKSWKDRRKTQYYPNGRGDKHVIILGPKWTCGKLWELEEYFKSHDIPYSIRSLCETNTKIINKQRVWTIIGGEWAWINHKIRPKGARKHLTIWKPKLYWKSIWGWTWIDLPKPRTIHNRIYKGYEVTWWSNKDIGIDHILTSKGERTLYVY